MNDSLKKVDLIGRLAQQIDLNADLPHEAGPPPNFPEIVAAKIEPIVSITPPPPPPPSAPDRSYDLPTLRKASPQIALDLNELRNKGFLTPQSYRPNLAEEYRIIKRPMLRSAFSTDREYSDRDHIALVTSPHASDGKTFTAVNLGMSIASEQDVHVLLIDGDVRQRGMSRAFGVSSHRGLMDVLVNKDLSVSDVILRTNVRNLSILPAGHLVEAPTEMFASPKMREVIGEITRRYADRFVIIDSPPALASSEPGVLASYVGQVVMVVQANETTKEAIKEALALVDACSNVNFILNKVTLSAGSDRFGYTGFYEDS